MVGEYDKQDLIIKEGWQAFESGFTQNPYPGGTNENHWWRYGWQQAERFNEQYASVIGEEDGV